MSGLSLSSLRELMLFDMLYHLYWCTGLHDADL